MILPDFEIKKKSASCNFIYRHLIQGSRCSSVVKIKNKLKDPRFAPLPKQRVDISSTTVFFYLRLCYSIVSFIEWRTMVWQKKLSYLQKDLFMSLVVDVMDVGVLSVDKMTGDGMISGLSYKNIMTVVNDNCK
jgi:hypothetical protein